LTLARKAATSRSCVSGSRLKPPVSKDCTTAHGHPSCVLTVEDWAAVRIMPGNGT
jgi:hypothetical protein